MTFRRLPLRRPAAAAFAALLAFGAGAPAFAEAPPASVIARTSPAGNYLAARLAGAERDTAAAAAYYRALVRVFPRNGEILERAFLTLLADGSIDEAVPLAKRIVEIDPSTGFPGWYWASPRSRRRNTPRPAAICVAPARAPSPR